MNKRVANALIKEARVGKFTMLGRKLGILNTPKGGLRGPGTVSQDIAELRNITRGELPQLSRDIKSALDGISADPSLREWFTLQYGNFDNFKRQFRDVFTANRSLTDLGESGSKARKLLDTMLSSDVDEFGNPSMIQRMRRDIQDVGSAFGPERARQLRLRGLGVPELPGMPAIAPHHFAKRMNDLLNEGGVGTRLRDVLFSLRSGNKFDNLLEDSVLVNNSRDAIKRMVKQLLGKK